MGILRIWGAALALCLSAKSVANELPTTAPKFGDPALLIDNDTWFRQQNEFYQRDSETRAYADLVAILYDWDNQRPWKNYVVEATRRLTHFREKVCADLAISICRKPGLLSGAQDVAAAQLALFEPATMALFEKRWNVRITPWILPGRDPQFSMIVAKSTREDILRSAYWDMQPRSVVLTSFETEMFADAPSYRAGFDNRDAHTTIAMNPEGTAINDRKLKQTAVNFAAEWKREARIPVDPKAHIIASAPQLQFRKLLELRRDEFERLHAELHPRIAHIPQIAKRFAVDLENGNFAEEIYQHVAYEMLLDLTRIQAVYLTMAQTQRTHLSQRQKTLESLLTLQRYAKYPEIFAMEMTTLIEEMNTRSYTLSQNVDARTASTFVIENLRAVLGLGHYEGKALFPKMGAILKNPVLFEADDIAAVAPEAVKALNGRKYTSLSDEEQAEVLRLYLEANAGLIRPRALMRMGTLFFANARREELRALAELIHQRIYGHLGN